MTKISLEPTLSLHAQIQKSTSEARLNPSQLEATARNEVKRTGMVFEANRELPVALTPLVLFRSDYESIRVMCERLHAIVERALDWLMLDPNRLERYFPDHRRVFQYLEKTKGSSSWQVISRFDAIVEGDGQIKIIELNTACPAGFFHSSGMGAITKSLLKQIDSDLVSQIHGSGAIQVDAFANGLLGVEADGGFSPELIGLVNDENKLLNELRLLSDQFRSMGREVEIVPAEEIEYTDGRATWNGKPISLTFNKVRISTSRSPNHRWRDGFEGRYSGFLSAVGDQVLASINSVMALTVAEDKGLLAVLVDPEFYSELALEEQEFVQDHVLPTARLVDEPVWWEGQSKHMIPAALEAKDKFVIKPANEGRGFGLSVGNHVSAEEWKHACQLDPDLPKVVQAHAEPARISVSRIHGSNIHQDEMYLTLGMAMIRGKFSGLLSRISRNPVTNISQSGMVQAVFLTDDQAVPH